MELGGRMSSATDMVIAYRLPQDGADEEAYGLCLGKEGNTLRVIFLRIEKNYERLLKSVLRRRSEKDAVVKSLESRLQLLKSKVLEESDTTRPKSCRMQEIMLRLALRRLEGVEEEEWALLSQQRCPSAVISAVGCTVACIATGKSLVSSTWKDAQRLLCSGKGMMLQLRWVGEKRLERLLYDSISETYLSDSTLSYSSASQESPSLGLLHKWITAFMDYQRAHYMEDREPELQRQIAGSQSSLQSARERRDSLTKQADLISKGICYSRTQTVRSVPIEHVLYLMTAERVTNWQYLLKERISIELLEETLAKSFAGQRSPRGSCGEEQSRMTTFSSARAKDPVSGVSYPDRTSIAALTHPAPKTEAARTGTWANRGHVRQPRASIADGSYVESVKSRCATVLSSIDPLGEWNDKASVAKEVKWASGGNSCVLLSSGKAAVTRGSTNMSTAIDAVTTSFSLITQVDRQNGVFFPSHAPCTPSASDDAQHVLADVKTHFKNVQETLLACFEEYKQLEEKYSNTVEQSQQLLQTLEERDNEIARLREDLGQATQKQLLVSGIIALQQQAQHGTLNGGQCNGHMNCSHDAPLHLGASSAFDAGTFARCVEYLLDDTLDFVRGVASAPAT
uniref:Uncharacterized protein n=1 Tax=Leishmania guyanensis TaxID=5670 RepID=A0A1E1IUG8_LEIGU|nr:hypothetical protein, unknown function [Leishmania guyanensis]